MVSTQQMGTLSCGEQKNDGFEALLAAIRVVAKKQGVALRREHIILEETEEGVVLSDVFHLSS